MKRTILLPLVFLLLSGPSMSAPNPAPRQTSPLEWKTRGINLRAVSIIEALSQIRSSVISHPLVFTLEVAPFHEAPDRNLDLFLQEATVGELLAHLVEQDSRYTYEVVAPNVIHVYPRGAKDNPHDLLNVPVTDFEITYQYDLLLKYPYVLIPSLQAEVMRRGKAGGIVGSMMGGAESPKVSVRLRRGTVRDVLNQVAQRTVEFQETPPSGWLYALKIEPSKPLGGEPTWNLF